MVGANASVVRAAIMGFLALVAREFGELFSMRNAIVFTAGIGENQASVRKSICQGLFDCLIKRPKIMVIPTNEELMIARQTYKLIKR